MSYDIEGWGYNEGSGDSGWLSEVMNAGDNVANYLPEGYANPTWDTSEHYSYEPGTNYGDDSAVSSENQKTDDVISLGSGYGGSGSYSVGSQWADSTKSSVSGLSSPTVQRSSSGNNSTGSSGQWLNTIVTQALQATKDTPTYSAPTWNSNRIKALTQKNFGTAANKLGNAVSEATTRSMSMDNPLQQKEYMRSTLRGYGEGLGSAQESAGQKALAEYVPEYQSQVDAAKTTYEAALKDYFATMKTVTTKDYEYVS